ncbi:MAG: 4-hydroxy-tetrahydrodipicolinate synthase [Bacteroidia bacterium]
MTKFSGTGVALVTPFTQTGDIDFTALRRLVKYVTDGGVQFLVALGTTGEPATMSRDEKKKVLEVIVEENAGKLPLVIGMGGNNTAALIEYALEIEQEFKPDAFLSVTPYYNKPHQEGLYQHYARLAEAVNTDIILYNVPGRTAINMLPATTLRLAADFENIVAVKEAFDSMAQCMELVKLRANMGLETSFSIMSGDDMLGMSQMAVGFDGVISVAANALPKAFSDIIDLAGKARMEEARKLHYTWLDIMNMHFDEGNPAGVKHSLVLQGVCEGNVRLPLVVASEALQARLANAWEKARESLVVSR